MKNHLKDNIFQSFLEVFEKDFPELTEAQRRRLAEKLGDKAYIIYSENSKGLSEQLTDMIKAHE